MLERGRDVWDALAPVAQDGLLALGLALPALLVGVMLISGFRPAPLIGAMLWRFRFTNLVFVGLIAVSVGIAVGLIAQERGLRAGVLSRGNALCPGNFRWTLLGSRSVDSILRLGLRALGSVRFLR